MDSAERRRSSMLPLLILFGALLLALLAGFLVRVECGTCRGFGLFTVTNLRQAEPWCPTCGKEGTVTLFRRCFPRSPERDP